MALKVKANEKLQKIGKYADTYRYVMQPELYTALSQDKVIREAALRSGVSQGVMKACWDAAGQVIRAWATEGHSVALPGLGSMRFGLRAYSVASVNDVKSSLIKSRRIIFTPDTELKDELKNTAIQITCYDRNGKEVKRVTSTDPAVIEDPETEGQNGTSEDEGGSTNSGNNISTPVISGTTPFEESTEVSMTGPDGAEIRYTTDGSTPTAESTLYESAFTLSNTATVKAIAIKEGESSQVATKYFAKGTSGSGGAGGQD